MYEKNETLPTHLKMVHRICNWPSSNLESLIKPKKVEADSPRFLLNSAFNKASSFSRTNAKCVSEANPKAMAHAHCCSASWWHVVLKISARESKINVLKQVFCY